MSGDDPGRSVSPRAIDQLQQLVLRVQEEQRSQLAQMADFRVAIEARFSALAQEHVTMDAALQRVSAQIAEHQDSSDTETLLAAIRDIHPVSVATNGSRRKEAGLVAAGGGAGAVLLKIGEWIAGSL